MTTLPFPRADLRRAIELAARHSLDLSPDQREMLLAWAETANRVSVGAFSRKCEDGTVVQCPLSGAGVYDGESTHGRYTGFWSTFDPLFDGGEFPAADILEIIG